jgi:hypothetical protein
MFKLFREIQEKRRLHRKLRAFYQETCKNWESFHVMDQQNRFIGFATANTELVKGLSIIHSDEQVRKYLEAIYSFNTRLEALRSFEQWYASEMKNKTRENAQKLHDLREEVEKYFLRLGPLINPIKEVLRIKLLREKVLKDKLGMK